MGFVIRILEADLPAGDAVKFDGVDFGLIQQCGFDAFEAFQAPLGVDQLFDQELLRLGLCVVLPAHGGVGPVVKIAVLAGNDHGEGAHAVTVRVHAAGGLASGRSWPGGFAGVAAIGGDLAFGGHGLYV